MRFSTDNGEFGIVVTPCSGYAMHKFQMIIGNQIVGDGSPGVIGTAVRRLRALVVLDDDRMGAIEENSESVFATLRADGYLHDVACLSIAESLDQWLIFGYIYMNSAFMLARKACHSGRDNRILVSSVPLVEYDLIARMVFNYWSETSGFEERA